MEVEADGATKTYETQTFALTTIYSGAYLCHPSLHLLSKLGVCQETISHIIFGPSKVCCDSFFLHRHNLEEIKKKKKLKSKR